MNSAAENHHTGALEEYARLKLELGGIVRALLHVAERRKDETSVQESRQLLARLAEDRLNLAILGQFSRGKSSLMNALLGSEKLPTGVLPLTSVITTVSYGESERVLLQREGWSFPQEIRLDQLPEYVTQRGNPSNEKRVTLAEIQLPNEVLRLGVHFIDTPGVASAIAANTRTTRHFLPEADAAILVTSFESPMTETELQFLQEVREHVRRVFIVVNKLDLVSAEDRDPVIESVRETVGATFPDSGINDTRIDVFAVSARDALQAKQESSIEALKRSGLPLLEAALMTFLRSGKARELLLRAAARAGSLARKQELAIRISQHVRSGQEALLLKQRLKERLFKLTQEREAIIQRIRNRLRLEFPRICEEKIGLWSAETEVRVRSELQSWFSREQGEIAGPAFGEFLQRLSQRLFSSWVDRNRSDLERCFTNIAEKEDSTIRDLANQISALPADVLGGERTPASSDIESMNANGLVFREIRLQLGGLQVPWWYEVLPLGRLRHLVTQRWLSRVPEFARFYQSTAFSLLETAADEWIEDLNRQIANRIKKMDSHISGVLEQEPERADLPEIEKLVDRLRAFERTVLGMGMESKPLSALSQSDAVVIRPCLICLRVERALWDFMAHRQYELSTSENEQQRHALNSGFCPLHTWQYEAVASPQGICAAYPQLLTLFAKRLRTLAENAPAVQSIENGVRSMLPKETRCPACQLVASTEEATARELARELKDDERVPVAVCAFHLRSILAAGPELKAANRLILWEARIFERLAEDMQNHILKHEAVVHHLSTRAGSEAATAGLSLLVGRRNTVASWGTE